MHSPTKNLRLSSHLHPLALDHNRSVVAPLCLNFLEKRIQFEHASSSAASLEPGKGFLFKGSEIFRSSMIFQPWLVLETESSPHPWRSGVWTPSGVRCIAKHLDFLRQNVTRENTRTADLKRRCWNSCNWGFRPANVSVLFWILQLRITLCLTHPFLQRAKRNTLRIQAKRNT